MGEWVPFCSDIVLNCFTLWVDRSDTEALYPSILKDIAYILLVCSFKTWRDYCDHTVWYATKNTIKNYLSQAWISCVTRVWAKAYCWEDLQSWIKRWRACPTKAVSNISCSACVKCLSCFYSEYWQRFFRLEAHLHCKYLFLMWNWAFLKETYSVVSSPSSLRCASYTQSFTPVC